MNKYRILNLIRKTILFLPVVIWRVLIFIFLPISVPMLFLMTDWEDDWDKKYFIKCFKHHISFGFWKHYE